MRVISGTARGRKLKEPSGTEVRPTSDMVKESIFNVVQFDIEGRHILDLFAGTGQLGVEALSRGAKSAVFVDISPEAVKLIKENILLCGFSDASTVRRSDALNYLEHCGTFDMIFVDPPFNTNLAVKTLDKIIEFDKLDTNGIIILEIGADRATPKVFPPYYLHKEYIYGSVKILKYEYRGLPGQL